MTQSGRWVVAGASAVLFVVVAFVLAADVSSDWEAGLQLFGLFGLLLFLNVAAIPGKAEDRTERAGQEWAKPYDG